MISDSEKKTTIIREKCNKFINQSQQTTKQKSTLSEIIRYIRIVFTLFLLMASPPVSQSIYYSDNRNPPNYVLREQVDNRRLLITW